MDYIAQNFTHIMADSFQLAEEPEFKDLYLDSEKAGEVTARWLNKYEKRLNAQAPQMGSRSSGRIDLAGRCGIQG